MTRNKLTLLILLHFNTKKLYFLFIIYNRYLLFFINNKLLYKILKVLIIKFKKQVFNYRILNNSLLMDKWNKFSRLDKTRKSLNRLNVTKQLNMSVIFNAYKLSLKTKSNFSLPLIWKEISNLIVSIGFSRQKIIFLTQPYLSTETYLLNLYSMGSSSAVQLNTKLKHFLFLNKHDKLANLANFCFLISPNEVNYKNLSYYRNRYVPIIGVSTTYNLNVMYDKIIHIPSTSETTVYCLLSFVLVNYISGRNLSMYYNSQVYYSQVLWFTFRKLELYRKLFYGVN